MTEETMDSDKSPFLKEDIMRKNYFKRLSVLMCVAMAISAFSACGSSKPAGSESANADSEQYATYWTDDQKATIDSITQIDEDGYLYEMNYVGDYHLDQIIDEGISNPIDMRAAFQKVNLPDSEFDIPTAEYGGGCSAFATKNADGHAILGRNYDWNKNEQVDLVIHSAPEGKYKAVAFADAGFVGVPKGFSTIEEKETLLYASCLVTDGMNEKGLACTILVLEEDGTVQNTDKPDAVSSMVVRLLLDNAATVDEAEQLLNKYDVISDFYKSRDEDKNGGADFHWLVTDKDGGYALFEYVDKKLVVNKTPVDVETDIEALGAMSTADINKTVEINYPKKDTGYLLATNFYATEGYENTNGEGYWRYKTLSNLLADNQNPTNKEAMEYLQKIKYGENDKDYIADLEAEGKDPEVADNWGWLTLWSEVFDTESLTVDYCFREGYDKVYTFGIE